MAKKNLTEEQQKSLLFLKSTFEMHCKTREEAMLRGKVKNIDKIEKIINETLKSMATIDKSFADKCLKEYNEKNKKFDMVDAIEDSQDTGNIYDLLQSEDENVVELSEDEGVKAETQNFYDQFEDTEPDLYKMADNINDEHVVDSFNQAHQEVDNVKDNFVPDGSIYNNVDPNAQYDLIPLPSKGECYKSKIESVPVGYLTASDENLITSPNLYESGNITSVLLKKKILNKDINVEELISGDVDAIMVFLRGTSYGNEFPIIATDPKTGLKIETSIDLSKLKYKSFTLKGDENGYFDFKLPLTGNMIKFKFLTKKDERLLQKLNKKESQGVAVYDINDAIEKIKGALMVDDKLNDSDRNVIIDASEKLKKWADNLGNNKTNTPYTKTITNTMEMQIVSVNGNTDKKFIHNFVMNMPAKDALAFRRYVYDNQPGVDFEVDVERPVSQGGGTFKCFLEWDDYVFWHIA